MRVPWTTPGRIRAPRSARAVLCLWCLALCPLLFAAQAALGSIGTVDNGLWGALLRAHVQGGVVDYAGMKRDEVMLDQYLDILSRVRPAELPADHRLAFWINAYNAWTVKLILNHYPGITSIKDIGSWLSSPWKKPLVKVGRETLTLDEVEHDIVRPRFRDPRVHFALNCASKGCPPLASEPYEGGRLQDQLDRAAHRFINDYKKNDVRDGVLHLSSIFKWYAEDFGGEKGVRAFVRQYAGWELAEALDRAGVNPAIEYQEYDWSLNDS